MDVGTFDISGIVTLDASGLSRRIAACRSVPGGFSRRSMSTPRTLESSNEERLADQFRPLRLAMGVYIQLAHVKHMQRIKIPGGRVTSEQLVALADVTERWGRSIAHVTTRQDIQLHYLEIEETVDLQKRPRRGWSHVRRRLRGHGSQRYGVAPRGRRRGRALRRDAPRPRRHRALPLPRAQPQAPSQVQGRLLGQQARLRPGDDQRHRLLRRRHRSGKGLRGLRGGRPRVDAQDRPHAGARSCPSAICSSRATRW